MANRSYLYALDTLPASAGERPRARGISEWNWDIPLAHKVLLSGSPKLVPSMIWDNDGVYAVVGDYEAGVANFAAFLADSAPPGAAGDVAEALAWLRDPANIGTYLWLEAAEIFDMDEGRSLKESAEALLSELKSDLSVPAAQIGPDQIASITGAGGWARTLYYSQSE